METPLGFISERLKDVPLPQMVKVRQTFPRPVLNNLENVVAEQIRAAKIASTIRKGDNIAVAVGSRGIANLPALIKQIVRQIKQLGANPFIFPAMGSHGGATPEGQKHILEALGICERDMGVPVKSSMETVLIGTTNSGLPVFLDRYANDADGLVIVNRIKPHVGFRGDYECGLVKMIAAGAGKQKGAEACHGMGFGQMAGNILDAAKMTIATGKLIFGVGILENAYNETCKLAFLTPEEILREEPGLLAEAKALSPGIPFQQLDVLLIDEIGKNIAGTGLDTNVVGRYHTPYASGGPDITKMVVFNLTDQSHRNANGIGIVDFTTRRLFEKMSFEQTYPNSLTSTVQNSVKIPMVLDNDRLAISAAIQTCNIRDKQNVRMVRIKNTKNLESFFASETLLDEIRGNETLTISGSLNKIVFDPDGNLLDMKQ